MAVFEERRSTIRIRRSSLAKQNLADINKPSIKISENFEEYEGAFRIVYDVYREIGYIKNDHHSKMSYSIYSMLPTTCVFIFKEHLEIISTLSQYLDSDVFGLPMDSLYKEEIDVLRNQGRKIAEIGALATANSSRWNNLSMFLGKAYLHYAKLTGVNDILIMVNPKHVSFYKAVFMFKDFGPEKHYPVVDAPAVALRINYDLFWERLEKTFKDHEFETNLHRFFSKINNTGVDAGMRFNIERNIPVPYEAAIIFFKLRPEIVESLTPAQVDYLDKYYGNAVYNNKKYSFVS